MDKKEVETLVAGVNSLYNRIQMNKDILDVRLGKWERPVIQVTMETFRSLFKGQTAKETHCLTPSHRVLRINVGEDVDSVTFVASESEAPEKAEEPATVIV